MAKENPSNRPENAMQTAILEDLEGFRELRSSWGELLDRVPTASIFQSFEWNHCWWQAFGKQDELFIVTCHKDAALVGIAPMMITRGRFSTIFPRTEIRFIGCKNYASDYLDFIIDPDTPEALGAILQEVLDHLGNVNRIRLSHFPTHLDNHSRVHDFLLSRRSRFTLEREHKAPYRLLGDTEDDNRTINKPTLRRRYNHFKKRGELIYRKCSNGPEILGYLEEFFEQHIARRQLTRVESQFLDPDQKNFYRLLVKELQHTPWLRFDAIIFNGRPLAFHFGFEFRNRFLWYKPTFDVQYYKHSPGQVLIRYLMEDCIERGLGEFDFTVGSESFKYRFANRERYNDRFMIFRSLADYWSHHITIFLLKMRERLQHLHAGLRSL